MITFKAYLQQKGEAFNTIRTRENTVIEFEKWLEGEGKTLKNTDYETMMNYLVFCKEKGNAVRTIRLKIKSLSHYFAYLMGQGKASANPAQLVQIKGGTKTVPTSLLTNEELSEIYNLQTTFGLIEKRNKVLLSLVVFQAVGSKELAMIEVKDVDLINGTIYVPALRTTNSRKLELKVQQLLLFQDYLMNVRPLILEKANKQSDFLLVSGGSGTKLTNAISLVLRSLRAKYAKLNDLQQIRQSVVSEWVNVYSVRKAQYMAGHKYVSSTERYNTDKLEQLKKSIKMRFPL